MSGRWPTDDLTDSKEAHPDQMYLTAPAGAVVIFNSHVWHGATLNTADRRRRGMTMSYARRDEPQQLDQKAYIRKVVYDRLTPAARHLMDV
jgi:ectoine hydroxylase-related dioxygenase (phytanoyl-CoA dioxygenase family)